jgi:hypothetical protein
MYIMCTRKVGVIYVQYLPIEFYLRGIEWLNTKKKGITNDVHRRRKKYANERLNGIKPRCMLEKSRRHDMKRK